MTKEARTEASTKTKILLRDVLRSNAEPMTAQEVFAWIDGEHALTVDEVVDGLYALFGEGVVDWAKGKKLCRVTLKRDTAWRLLKADVQSTLFDTSRTQ